MKGDPSDHGENATTSSPSIELIASDLVLLLLRAGQEGKDANRLDGITRLEKLLFLADMEEMKLSQTGFKPVLVPASGHSDILVFRQ